MLRDTLTRIRGLAVFAVAWLRTSLMEITTLQHRDSSANIPIPTDQHHISDVAKWR